MLEALEKRFGIVTPAAEDIGIDRKTHYRWIKNDSKYAEAVEDITNAAIDLSESKLLENVMARDTKAIIFHLSTIGKKRGYVQRPELASGFEADLDQIIGIRFNVEYERKNGTNQDKKDENNNSGLPPETSGGGKILVRRLNRRDTVRGS